jgi:hypothetical protein
MQSNENLLQMGFAQIAPVWLDGKRTMEKIVTAAEHIDYQGLSIDGQTIPHPCSGDAGGDSRC